MVFAITALVIFITLLFILGKLVKIGFKIIGSVALVAIILSTASLWILKPQMHKPFSINVIEYLLKINDDGSMTTTKQITKTVIQEKKQVEEK